MSILYGLNSYEIRLTIMNNNVSVAVHRIGNAPVNDDITVSILHPTDPAKTVDARITSTWSLPERQEWSSIASPNFMTQKGLEAFSKNGKFAVHIS